MVETQLGLLQHSTAPSHCVVFFHFWASLKGRFVCTCGLCGWYSLLCIIIYYSGTPRHPAWFESHLRWPNSVPRPTGAFLHSKLSNTLGRQRYVKNAVTVKQPWPMIGPIIFLNVLWKYPTCFLVCFFPGLARFVQGILFTRCSWNSLLIYPISYLGILQGKQKAQSRKNSGHIVILCSLVNVECITGQSGGAMAGSCMWSSGWRGCSCSNHTSWCSEDQDYASTGTYIVHVYIYTLIYMPTPLTSCLT